MKKRLIILLSMIFIILLQGCSQKNYHKTLLNGEWVYVIDQEYNGEYKIQYPDNDKVNNDDYCKQEIMNYDDYRAYCEQWSLLQDYSDPALNYIVMSEICRGYGKVAIADVKYADNIATVYINEEIYGRTTAGEITYCVVIPVPHNIDNVKYEICFSEEQLKDIKFREKYDIVDKPVIYLYPQKKQKVCIELNFEGEFTCTYPEYQNGWILTAYPDGTLIDKNGVSYNYLYYEATLPVDFDFSKGYCVRGKDTAKFLEKILSQMGLNRKEANEFIVYWLPRMQDNKYNLISFQIDNYKEAIKLNVTPKPDTLIRVFMAYKPVNEFIDIDPQDINKPRRDGFTVVEWGGTCAEEPNN